MTPRLPFALIAIALVGCETTGGGGASSGGGTGTLVAESGTKRGSAGGFSSSVGQELGAPEGSLGAAAPGASPTAGSTPGASTGSAAGSSAGSLASSAPGAGSPAAGASAPPAGSGAVAAKGSAAASTPAGAPGATKPAAGSAGAAAPGGAATAGATPPAGTGAATPPAGTGAATPAAATPAATPSAGTPSSAKLAKRVYVKPSAELAAIKFDLEPNWERDYGEAGTFSLVVKLPGSEETRVFAVRYGYDDQSAPVDCDQYRKFLDENRVMTVTVNRQRSGACYVEGTDRGVVSFRYLINYGGKRLMCQGSLYKDAASASLGDLRDKVLMQAKKICETLAL